LTRKNNESVIIGGAEGLNRLLKVTVIEVGKGKVRLGFEAADDLAVHRSEVWEQIQANGPPCQKGNGNEYI
jgi:carbon storage regulator CsrA